MTRGIRLRAFVVMIGFSLAMVSGISHLGFAVWVDAGTQREQHDWMVVGLAVISFLTLSWAGRGIVAVDVQHMMRGEGVK